MVEQLTGRVRMRDLATLNVPDMDAKDDAMWWPIFRVWRTAQRLPRRKIRKCDAHHIRKP